MKTETKTKKLSAPTAEGQGGVVRRAAMLLLAVMMTTTATWADDVNYIDADGSSKSHDATALADSETGWTGWYVASGAVEISDRVVVTGEAHLILADGATLTIPKGITVTEGNSLTIYGQALGTGSLTIASPESGYAGIGGYVTDSGSYTAANTGSITINGGIIDVIGSNVTAGGAAIGGVYWGNTGSITINGGSVTATGKWNGAGIGCGPSASGGGTITITGGMVVSTSAAGAGIGGANQAVTPNIYISGGNVTASSTGVHAGIGGGCGRSANIITISGGTVTATGVNGGAGIGGGTGNTGTPPGTCGTVTITGGTVTAIGGEGAAGIGGGRPFGPAYTGNNGGTIIITGGNVTAHTTYHATYGGGYGIGHGYAGNSTGLTADIRLSYTAASNSINAEGYTGAVTITDSKTMSDGTDTYTGVLTSDEITAIAGKTLTASTYGVTANSANGSYWATFHSGVAGYQTPSGTTAYIATLTDGNTKVDLTEVAGGFIPAEKAVILKSTSASISLTRAATGTAFDFSTNSLLGGSTVTDGYDAYTLAAVGGVMGFYKFTGAALDPNKAHLEIPQSSPAPARGFIGFGEDGTTSLREVKNEEVKSEKFDAGAWYSLDGRRLNGQPTQKGVYVNSGRKVVIK